MTMHKAPPIEVPSKISAAIDDLKGMILERFPQATFVVQEGDDPTGIYLLATVDIDDTDDVVDIIIDRLIEFQVYEELPLYFIPLRPINRVLADIEARRASGAPWLQQNG